MQRTAIALRAEHSRWSDGAGERGAQRVEGGSHETAQGVVEDDLGAFGGGDVEDQTCGDGEAEHFF